MSSNLKVNTILPSVGSNIGLGTNGGNLNIDGGCKVQVGTALTLGHTVGVQFATQNLHSEGFEVNQINASGIITATSFVGSGANLTGVSQVSVTNQADNRLITATGTTDALNAEADITYDGTILALAGGKYINSTSPYRVAGHPVLGYDNFTDISGGSYATRLGSTGTSTLRSTQIYGGGSHLATFDGVNSRLGLRTTTPAKDLHVYNPSVATVRIETGDSRGQAWDLLSTNGANNNTGTLSFRDESGSAYLEFGANGGSPELTVRNGGANDLLHIDQNGNVTTPRNAFAIIHTNSGDAGVSNNKIKDAYAVFTGVHLNQGSHYSTSTGRFTCPVDGVYGIAFASNLNMSSMSVGNNFNIQTRKNGSIQLYNYDTVFTTGWQYMSFTNYVNCNANDWLAIYYGGSQPFGADQGSGVWGELYFWLVQ